MTSLTILSDRVVSLAGAAPVRALNDVDLQPSEATIVCEGDLIASVTDGDASGATIDARGWTVVPGFVDCHTHLPFYGWRADEDRARLSGERYEDIHGRSGGIFRSARMIAEASDEDVLAFGQRLARSMLATGTTTFETKSGYGLSVEAELRQLSLARRLAERVPQIVTTTCLAAHAVPEGMSEGQWIGVAADELLPKAAEYCSSVDIYVETIAFQLEHAARLATAAEQLGLAMRMHADQLSDGQAGAFAARWNFRSADHLNHTSLDAVGDLVSSETAAVLLPGATYTLRQTKKPPARDLVDAGAIVALGTDLNPGTSPIHSMPFAMALACRLYGLSPAEALVAGTVNAAYVLGLQDEVGRLEPGMRADAVVLMADSFEEVVYRPDENLVGIVICGGEIAYVAPGAEARVKGGL
ncbi:MAG TPA: imidazolonepropionase [Actinomycetota bacterium]|nr:imidazolonepropionase [Actinomycetota bacterium]